MTLARPFRSPTRALVLPLAAAVALTRLTLEDYKTTLKGLTQFGDRRQGTQRNRDAVDWIEAQLQAVGCTNTERIIYQFDPPPPTPRPRPAEDEDRALLHHLPRNLVPG